MATDISIATSDLAEFHAFVGEYLGKVPRLTPADIWELWLSRPGTAEYEASVAALRESIAEVESGASGITMEDFDREVSAKYNFPPRT